MPSKIKLLQVETNHGFNAVASFLNDDFTPSHCINQRQVSSSMSDKMNYGEGSSNMIRQSDNTFNPDNYEFIPVIRDSADSSSYRDIAL